MDELEERIVVHGSQGDGAREEPRHGVLDEGPHDVAGPEDHGGDIILVLPHPARADLVHLHHVSEFGVFHGGAQGSVFGEENRIIRVGAVDVEGGEDHDLLHVRPLAELEDAVGSHDREIDPLGQHVVRVRGVADPTQVIDRIELVGAEEVLEVTPGVLDLQGRESLELGNARHAPGVDAEDLPVRVLGEDEPGGHLRQPSGDPDEKNFLLLAHTFPLVRNSRITYLEMGFRMWSKNGRRCLRPWTIMRLMVFSMWKTFSFTSFSGVSSSKCDGIGISGPM